VFGAVAGDSMAAWVRNEAMREPDRAAIDAAIAQCERPFKSGARGDLEPLREKLYDTMWEKVGIIRDAAGLEGALDDLHSIETELRACSLGDANRSFNLTWHDWLNLESLATVSRVIATAALARRDSRGAHFRSDFPDSGALESSSFTSMTLDGHVSMRPVEFTRVRPGQSLLKNAA
jgi:fumarate reductase flavoprotein subunit